MVVEILGAGGEGFLILHYNHYLGEDRRGINGNIKGQSRGKDLGIKVRKRV